MAKKSRSRHLKRIAIPKSWHLPKKKVGKFAKKPWAGKHALKDSVPIGVFLREIVGVAENMSQAKKLLNSGEILVDGLIEKNEATGVGLMDVVSIPKLSADYRIIFTGKGLAAVKLPKGHSGEKLCKVVNKQVVSKGLIQLNLHDGRNYLIEKEEDVFKTGDTIKIAVPKQELKGFLKLEKGCICYVHRGRHAGEIAALEQVLERAGSKESDAKLKKENGSELITLKSYLFVVDKDFVESLKQVQ